MAQQQAPAPSDASFTAPGTPPEAQGTDYLEKLKRGLLATRVPQALAGVGESLEKAGASAVNVPLGLLSSAIGHDVRAPVANWEKYIPQDPYSRAAFEGGNILGYIAPGTKVEKLLGSGAEALGEAIPAIGKYAERVPGMLKKVLSGGTAGALIGAQGKEDPHGRLIGALLGSGGEAVKSMLAAPMAKNLASSYKSAKSLVGGMYDDVFNSVKNEISPASKVEIPKEIIDAPINPDSSEEFKTITTPSRRAITKFKNNPTFENAHDLQRSLGAEERNIGRAQERSEMSKSETAPEFHPMKVGAKNLAGEMRTSVIDKMHEHLERSGRSDLSQKLRQASYKHATEVVPLQSGQMSKYLKKPSYFRATDLVKALQKSENIAGTQIEKRIPGFASRAKLAEASSRTPPWLKTGALLASLYGASKLGVPTASAYSLTK